MRYFLFSLLIFPVLFSGVARADDTATSTEKEKVRFSDDAPAFPREIVEILQSGRTPKMPSYEGECKIETLTGRRWNPKEKRAEVCRWQGDFGWQGVDNAL